jgi:voltage-gated potassium channel Kch
MRALVIGDLEVARVTCALLAERKVEVVHLLQPSDTDLRTELDGSFDAVAVLVRGDVTALRYVLLVEHIRPGVRLVATVFDRTLAEKLREVVPNCSVNSPADIAVPSIVGACLADGTLAVDFDAPAPRRLVRDEDGLTFVAHGPAHTGRPGRLWAAVGRLSAHDEATRIMLFGLAGLLVILFSDWIITVTALHTSMSEALYAATRVVTTVGPGEAHVEGRTWYAVVASVMMLVTVILTAIFTAGVVNRILSSRSITLVGRRVPPRRDHVVIVGLGQVGVRLAIALRTLGIGVIVVERDPAAPNLRLARKSGVPVFVGHAQDVDVLRRVGLSRARAFAAMGADDLDNIEAAIAASTVAPEIPIALRAGESELIAETRSLFRIGEVRDVTALTALAVAESMAGSAPVAVFAEAHRSIVYDGEHEIALGSTKRCACGARP